MTEFSFKPEAFANNIPAGRYRALIEKVEYKTSKAGNPMIVARFLVSVAGKKRGVNGYYMCSGKKSQLSRTEAFLRIAYPDRIPDRLNTEIFTNKSVEIDIMYEPKSEGAPPFCKVAAVYPSIEAGSAVAIKGDFIDVPKSSTPEFNTFAESSVKPGD